VAFECTRDDQHHQRTWGVQVDGVKKAKKNYIFTEGSYGRKIKK
jgi:hypothetical protein